MKKQFMAAILCAAMAFTMVACGNADVASTEGATETSGTQVTSSFDYKPLPTAEEANVVLGDFENLTIKLEGDYEVSEAVINELAENVMANYGLSNKLVEDRDVIADGDYVMVDYTGYLNDEAFDGGAATDQLLDVTNNCMADGSTGFIDGFTAGLIGQKVGDTVKYDVTFPENYGSELLNGQTTQFEFVIKGIYTKQTVADLTDEMVAENFEATFGVATKDDFLGYIKAYLVSSATYDYVQSYVIENSSCVIPDNYLDYITDMYIEYLAVSNFGSMEDMVSAYESYGYSVDDLTSGIRENLATEIQSEIIFTALADKMGIEVTEDKKNEMISSYLVENGGSYESREAVILEMGLGNAEFGEEYALVACRTSEVITQIVTNSTVIDADGNILSE